MVNIAAFAVPKFSIRSKSNKARLEAATNLEDTSKGLVLSLDAAAPPPAPALSPISPPLPQHPLPLAHNVAVVNKKCEKLTTLQLRRLLSLGKAVGMTAVTKTTRTGEVDGRGQSTSPSGERI
jgi:hypothetical protein